jgi:hypothetical protein
MAQFLTHFSEIEKSVALAAETSQKANADRIEMAMRDLALAIRSLRETWSTLSETIKLKADYIRGADEMSEKQMSALSYLQKVGRFMANAQASISYGPLGNRPAFTVPGFIPLETWVVSAKQEALQALGIPLIPSASFDQI